MCWNVNSEITAQLWLGLGCELFKRRCRLDIRKFVYGNRVVDKWNCLSDSCINCSTLNCFKTNISLELDRKPELPDRWKLTQRLLHSSDSPLDRTELENVKLCASFSDYFADKINTLKQAVATQKSSSTAKPTADRLEARLRSPFQHSQAC